MPEIFPLTGWQYHLIWLHQNKAVNRALLDLMTLGSALWIKPGISPRRVDRAFRALCQRHDILRSRFHRLGGDWKCTLADHHPLGVEVHDYSDTAEADIPRITRAHGRTYLDLEDRTLVRADLLRFGAGGDVLVFRFHHTITDGFGLAVLFEDMISLMLGLSLTRPVVSHATYMQGWGGDTAPQSAQAEAYWQDVLCPPPAPLNIGRAKQGMPVLQKGLSWTRSKTLTIQLEPHDAQSICDMAQAEGVSPFLLANAAFLEALTTGCGAEETLYSVTLGRSDGRLSGYAGHHTLHPLMRYRKTPGGTLANAARAAAGQMVDLLNHMPSPALRASGLWDQRLIDMGAYPRQIMTGVLAATARVNASPFPDVFSLSADTPFKVGSLELRDIPIPIDPGGSDELNFRPNFDAQGGVVQIKYATDGIEDAEIDVLTDDMFARLEIDPQNRHVLDAPPDG